MRKYYQQGELACLRITSLAEADFHARADLSPVTYTYFLQDFEIITLDMAARQRLGEYVARLVKLQH